MPSSHALPPLSTLRVFEAAARQQSFVLAATELHLTPGAVSKQIRQLEEHLGQLLFERLHREVRLTPAGATYARAITQIFGELRTATSRARVAPTKDKLILWCAPWVMKLWLLPRLNRFRASNVNLQLELRTGESSDKIDPEADIAIRLGSGDWPRTRCEFLIPQEITAVCTPAYLRRARLSAPFRFQDFVVLDSADAPHRLKLWKEANGLENMEPKDLVVFQNNETAFSAALSDHGLALVNPQFVESELSTGKLVCPFAAMIRTGLSYWLTWHERYDLRPAAGEFRKWILAEFQQRDTSLPPAPD